MVKNAVRQITELQKHVEAVKNESAAAREAALKQLRIHMENEKREVWNQVIVFWNISLLNENLYYLREKQ